VDDFVFQLSVFGCVYLGDTLEPSAQVAEARTDRPPLLDRSDLWDSTARRLEGSFVDRGAGWEPCPRWWALPGVAELLWRHPVWEAAAHG
jgi:hypothetical protein